MDEFSGFDAVSDDQDVYGTRAFKVDKWFRLTGVTFSQSPWRRGVNEAKCLNRNRVLDYRSAPSHAEFYRELAGMTQEESALAERKRREAAGRPSGVAGVLVNQFSYDVQPNYGGIPIYSLLYAGGQYPNAETMNEWDKKKVSDVPHRIDLCAHGFYAYYEGSNDYGPKQGNGLINGVIQASGRTTIGSRGFRSSKAEIVALHIPKNVSLPTQSLIRRNYPDVPVFSSFKAMVSEFPPSSGEAKVGPDADPEFWDRPV